ncbi:erythromycin esterase family protein [Actinacidiphila glaucinigra]|uniref:erythromycin esterase family protein n=2 Tax=Actinacidiphila glaucinigra TaxID=235986 RepID=UPI002DDBDA83|nr:erythromycin esterase family protein [Actinacidiphila glaucinigra]WSD64293.1 erythromycin esterase family protein [Actinacidiphila glaucinigra]
MPDRHAGDPQSHDPELTAWLARNALPLNGLDAGAPTGDLRPLGRVLRGVRVVGLGEATHGTGEFFRLKHRLLEFLVTELGFSVLAMEASASAGPAVDACVRQGAGDPVAALTGLGFWIWRTHEVLSAVEWLRVHNATRPEHGRVRFAGIDPQQCGDSLRLLDAFLRETAPDRVSWLHTALGPLATAAPGSAPDPRQRLVREAETLVDLVRGRAIGAAGPLHHARILVRAADLVTRPRQHADPERTVFAARDRHMADAVDDALSDPAARVVVWAHNAHIAKGRHDGGPAPLGRHLHARYGDAYYALALLFGRGGFRARILRPGPWRRSRPRPPAANRIGPPPPGSLEALLAAAHPGDHLVDLRAAAEAGPAVRRRLAEPRPARSIGAQVPRRMRSLAPVTVVPAEDYDGLAYVATSTCSRPLPPPA